MSRLRQQYVVSPHQLQSTTMTSFHLQKRHFGTGCWIHSVTVDHQTLGYFHALCYMDSGYVCRHKIVGTVFSNKSTSWTLTLALEKSMFQQTAESVSQSNCNQQWAVSAFGWKNCHLWLLSSISFIECNKNKFHRNFEISKQFKTNSKHPWASVDLHSSWIRWNTKPGWHKFWLGLNTQHIVLVFQAAAI